MGGVGLECRRQSTIRVILKDAETDAGTDARTILDGHHAAVMCPVIMLYGKLASKNTDSTEIRPTSYLALA